MTNAEVPQWLLQFQERVGDRIKKVVARPSGDMEIWTSPSQLLVVIQELKKLDGGAFDHLADLTAYDAAGSSPRFHVVYELISMLRRQRLAIVVPLNDDELVIPSVTSLWKGANWLEREVYDLLGIKFEGHPDLRRILLPDSFKGHPLRKDFLFDYRQDFEGKGSGVLSFDPFGHNVIRSAEEER